MVECACGASFPAKEHGFIRCQTCKERERSERELKFYLIEHETKRGNVVIKIRKDRRKANRK